MDKVGRFLVNGQAVSVEDCLTLEYLTERWSRNVSNYQSTPRNIPEERISNLHRGGILNSLSLRNCAMYVICYAALLTPNRVDGRMISV